MTRALLATVAALALSAGVGPVQAATSTVEARDNVFAPSTRTVSVGDTVTWRNTGAVAHEVTANDASFASGNIAPGASWSYRTTSARTIGYYCRYHGTATSGMTGTLTVAAAGTHPRTGGGRQVQAGLAVLAACALLGLGLRSVRAGAR